MAVVKILCPWHTERTPSCAIYPEEMRVHCYSCGAGGHISMLPEEHLRGLEVSDFRPRPREDVLETIRYISSLPMQTHRGLSLHTDSRSFYLVWPDKSYYLRRFTDGSEPKYKGPSGHDRPLYRASASRDTTLILTEGELNAASIAVAYPGNVVSIGGVGNFTQQRLIKYLPEFNRYGRLLVLLDDDPAGTLAAIEAGAFFRSHHKEVKVCLLKHDANWVLDNEGKNELKRLVENCLGRRLETGSEEW